MALGRTQRPTDPAQDRSRQPEGISRSTGRYRYQLIHLGDGCCEVEAGNKELFGVYEHASELSFWHSALEADRWGLGGGPCPSHQESFLSCPCVWAIGTATVLKLMPPPGHSLLHLAEPTVPAAAMLKRLRPRLQDRRLYRYHMIHCPNSGVRKCWRNAGSSFQIFADRSKRAVITTGPSASFVFRVSWVRDWRPADGSTLKHRRRVRA